MALRLLFHLVLFCLQGEFGHSSAYNMKNLKAKIVLTDIEGTTTSISFVKDTLFPYAKQHTHAYLEQTWNETETKDLVKQLESTKEYKEFGAQSAQSDLTVISNFVNYLIDKDVKLGPLKTLQGLVWARGYERGQLEGHVYDDVPCALRRWQKAGVQIAIYSSGSVKAQKLLFGKTHLGNLLPYISGHFDTAVGHKQEQQSYENIANELGAKAEDIVFLTDIVNEAVAAKAAGMQTVILDRPGNAPFTDDDKSQFTIINDFNRLEVNLA